MASGRCCLLSLCVVSCDRYPCRLSSFGPVHFFFNFNKYPSLLLSWMFEHDCLDTRCFGYLTSMFFCICTCSVQFSMFHMERRYRNMLIILLLLLLLFYGAGIAQLVVLGLAAKVSRVRYSSGDIFR